jgi:hypothetical protein
MALTGGAGLSVREEGGKVKLGRAGRVGPEEVVGRRSEREGKKVEGRALG